MRMTIVAATAALLLAACSGGGDEDKPAPAEPEPTRLEAGLCLSGTLVDGDDLSPDPETTVACTEPHVWEIVGTHDIAAEFLAGSTDEERLANRTELATTVERSALSKRFATTAFTQCFEDVLEVTGLAELPSGKAGLVPVGRLGVNSPWLTVTPQDQWLDGTPQAICSVFFHGTSPQRVEDKTKVEAWEPTPQQSLTGAPVISTYLTGQFPAQLRVCRSEDGSCEGGHARETLWNFDARRQFGAGFIVGEPPKTVPEADHQQILAFCRKALAAVPDAHAERGAVGWVYYDNDVGKDGLLDDDRELYLGCSFTHGEEESGWHAWGSTGATT